MNSKHLLYLQLVFVALAFAGMVVLSYFCMSNTVYRHLVRNSENMLAFEQNKIETALKAQKCGCMYFRKLCII